MSSIGGLDGMLASSKARLDCRDISSVCVQGCPKRRRRGNVVKSGIPTLSHFVGLSFRYVAVIQQKPLQKK